METDTRLISRRELLEGAGAAAASATLAGTLADEALAKKRRVRRRAATGAASPCSAAAWPASRPRTSWPSAASA